MGWDGVGRLTLVSVNRRLASGQIDLVELCARLPIVNGNNDGLSRTGNHPRFAGSFALTGSWSIRDAPTIDVIIKHRERSPRISIHVVVPW